MFTFQKRQEQGSFVCLTSVLPLWLAKEKCHSDTANNASTSVPLKPKYQQGHPIHPIRKDLRAIIRSRWCLEPPIASEVLRFLPEWFGFILEGGGSYVVTHAMSREHLTAIMIYNTNAWSEPGHAYTNFAKQTVAQKLRTMVVFCQQKWGLSTQSKQLLQTSWSADWKSLSLLKNAAKPKWLRNEILLVFLRLLFWGVGIVSLKLAAGRESPNLLTLEKEFGISINHKVFSHEVKHSSWLSLRILCTPNQNHSQIVADECLIWTKSPLAEERQIWFNFPILKACKQTSRKFKISLSRNQLHASVHDEWLLTEDFNVVLYRGIPYTHNIRICSDDQNTRKEGEKKKEMRLS